VKILPGGKGGKIEISYYSAQDLDRLLEILGIG
jgi:ParB family chromosome partitioning protein